MNLSSAASLPVEDDGFHCRVHHPEVGRTLVYLPGMHGDWTLLGPFRNTLRNRCRLLEFTYPRRVDWTLTDYADAVLAELNRLGIRRGWLLGESFSSQIVWTIQRTLLDASAEGRDIGFTVEGIILVGGFVKYPLSWGVRLAHRASRAIPSWLLGLACASYGRVAKKRCVPRACDFNSRDSADPGAEIDLFVARRLSRMDREAVTSRYILIRDGDCRGAARETRCPVFCLTGAWDPIVPWPLAWRWLKRRCPGYRDARVIWKAGHNVLLDAPAESAEQILQWIEQADSVRKAEKKA